MKPTVLTHNFEDGTFTTSEPIIITWKGRANAKGTCVVIDADGDKIFVEWQCSGKMPACPGTERFVGDTGAGWSDWKGQWKLP